MDILEGLGDYSGKLESMLDGFYNFIMEVLEKRESGLRFNVPFLNVSEIDEVLIKSKLLKIDMRRSEFITLLAVLYEF